VGTAPVQVGLEPSVKDAMNTIDAYGDPLAFKVRKGRESMLDGKDPAERVFKVEARQMSGHQKEAVVTMGEAGSGWRLTSDEGVHLKGTDLAPFPLGFFNAGLQSDLYGRLRHHAKLIGVTLDSLNVRLENRYWLTGSFTLGTGEGHAEPTQVELNITSRTSAHEVRRVVDEALASSPAMALLRTPLENTFALYINGRRRHVEGVRNSVATDASDPYITYSAPPRPLPEAALPHPVSKAGRQETGSPVAAPASTDTRIVRTIKGEGCPIPPEGCFELDTWLAMPGASHFKFRTDEGRSDMAPCGLALLSAAISFCYMTQLSRYIEHMRLAIKGVRLVQFNPYRLMTDVNGNATGVAAPIDTHLFLNGEAPEETHAKLLLIAARTCYLHATATTALAPVVRIVHNGSGID
jgi:uncharacterized OsmC-like protein